DERELLPGHDRRGDVRGRDEGRDDRRDPRHPAPRRFVRRTRDLRRNPARGARRRRASREGPRGGRLGDEAQRRPARHRGPDHDAVTFPRMKAGYPRGSPPWAIYAASWLPLVAVYTAVFATAPGVTTGQAARAALAAFLPAALLGAPVFAMRPAPPE